MDKVTLFLVAALFVTATLAAPKKIEVSFIDHDNIEETNDGGLVYTPHGTVIVGDIEIELTRNGILNPSHRWPQGRIYYTISQNYSSAIHDTIIAAMRELEHDINGASGHCIQFIPRTNQVTYIEIHAGTGCHSIIGFNNHGKQDVSIGAGCELKGIIMHELIHTIGFWHEQSRPDRDNYINIDLNNVKAESRHDFNLHPVTEATTLNTAYDFGSIMHYGVYTFALDRSKPVITAKPGKASDTTSMGQRLSLSTTDVLKIQRLYGCTEDTTHITKPTTLTKCTFESTECGLVIEHTTFNWIHGRGVIADGPHAGYSFGTDSYLIAVQSPTHATGVAKIHSPTYRNGPVCVDLYFYQKGPSSYLDVVVQGPHLTTTVVKNYHNNYQNNWVHSRTSVNVPVGTEFTVTFQAHMVAGDVAIDDVHIYQGHCV
ncbi:meprin A subunit alpha [Biomphalaria glabrata]|nr:meprin A subunit alpha [Biomphalaria glabrata]